MKAEHLSQIQAAVAAVKERKPIRRTVTVCSTDSVHASALVYQQFGRKKIKVKSAKKVKESE